MGDTPNSSIITSEMFSEQTHWLNLNSVGRGLRSEIFVSKPDLWLGRSVLLFWPNGWALARNAVTRMSIIDSYQDLATALILVVIPQSADSCDVPAFETGRKINSRCKKIKNTLNSFTERRHENASGDNGACMEATWINVFLCIYDDLEDHHRLVCYV